jgi:Fe-S oxidoreductase
MPRHGTSTFCCGAGGGRSWFEERPEQRVNRLRAAEAAATGANTLVTACPFCLNMMADGLAATPAADSMRLIDVAELLLESTAGGDQR